ncbi:MAG: bifunctional demethylmenaquinone methyltransferase/2-methoxy-6-polyprenyl-1,4-benzoquinol methylase UbiE [Waddliaceae bacterium]
MADYNPKDPHSIKKMFGSIANQYDRANKFMSLNMHKRWNRKLVGSVVRDSYPKKYLDLCCGTGDIAYSLLHQIPHPCEAFLLDFCPEMLTCAKNKTELYDFGDHRIHFINDDAQKIPLPSESIDCVTIAYGIRNVQDPLQCVKEVFRVLRTGGCFGILELTRPDNPLVNLGHKIYLKTMLPIVGKWFTTNQEAYHYLRQSIQTFIPATNLESILIDAGFRKVSRRPLSGGIATILIGKK